jgi:uncharacterized protein
MSLPETLVSTCFWRRLDNPGTDACRLYQSEEGWLLRGTAVFHEAALACSLRYEARTDRDWRTLGARVRGHRGGQEISLEIVRLSAERWLVNGEPAELDARCDDIDLGFTPATNQIALRRMSLAIGEARDCHSAWLNFPNRLDLQHLPQTYRRLDAETYDYQSPTAGYGGKMQVLESGVVALYPELFELVEG